ncbi:transglycosylase domain-containing protein [[Clostridium] polysaccharolyticum]|uniref:Penicillin-binding protein 1A n=1 Tax=[Clostridium] polysaccharolyticum TaxID=29364 RepID=A0A1I0FQ37_9FIRM|nr:PBP1A family penicillin-binding protein [[Clostridium] polysaccharolyticum]SET60277.1 penicillin-binding protein, 1A family [[Clostridium] polysaccharolyticum]
MAKRKKKKKNKVLSAFAVTFKFTVLILFAVVLVGGGFFYFKYGRGILKLQSEARALVKESTVDTFKQSQTSTVYDYKGEELLTLSGEKKLYYLSYDEIPDFAKKAMISIEDKKFTTHKGVDYKAIVRALVAYVKNKGEIKQGASTITQQLARNIFLSYEVSWSRKIKEMFVAMDLERKYSKYQILEFYLNNIYFSNGYYGIEAASRGYFNCPAVELSLSQISYLCAIPNNPTLYNPVNNPENTIKRRDRILKQMLEDGWIGQSEYDKAVAEKVVVDVKNSTKKENYVTTFVLYSATRALMEANGFQFENSFETTADQDAYNERYDEQYNECSKSLYSGGYQIYTSINMEHQDKLQESVDETLKDFTDTNKEGTYLMQGAAVSIDNATGRVVAVVGGRKQDINGYTLNRAYQSYRQPGSSIKPLAVYTPAFENGYTPDSVKNDQKFEGGPRNSDGTYLGNITLRKAVAKSKNTIAWRLFEEITPTIGLSYLKNMNFQKIVSRDYTAAASLGGLTYGVSPVEMASGFAAIENDGVYRVPTCIIKITDSDGKELVPDEIKEKTVYSQNASRMMVSALQSVMTEGTGAGLRLQGMSCAGKTGTTNDKKDGWFVGFTPYFTTSVWIGYDNPTSIQSLTGASYPGTVWKNYMSWANEGLQDSGFKKYKGAVSHKPQETVKPDDNKDKDKEEAKEEEENAEVKPSEKPSMEEVEKPSKTPASPKPKPSKKPEPSEKEDDGSDEYGGDDIPDQDPGWDESENNQPGAEVPDNSENENEEMEQAG